MIMISLLLLLFIGVLYIAFVVIVPVYRTHSE